MVKKSDDQVELKTLCFRFLRLFDAYATNLRLSSSPSDIVLKVVPNSIIGSPSSIAIPTVSELIRISKDVYDSCPNESASISPYASSALVQLTPEVPDGVDFKLTQGNPMTLLQQDAVAHIAYCWDDESPWLTAALTDSLGCHSWSASFHTGTSSDTLAMFRAIVKEVLDVAREALEEAHGSPKIIIACDRPVPPVEVDGALIPIISSKPNITPVWTSIAHAQDMALAFARLDSKPPVQLLSNKASPVETCPRLTIGPADLTSPDSNAPRMSEELDSAARLVDPVEEVKAVITASMVEVSQDRIDLPPSLGSGYLVNARGIIMGMSIVAAESYDLDIRSLLRMSYDLTCLSKARGGDPALPWHVAIARQAQIGLLAAEV
jgi:Mediator complex subunit 13 C-terminal domain